MSKTATCGTPGNRCSACSIAASAGALCSGASSSSAMICSRTSRVDHDRLAEARPAVDDAMGDGADLRRLDRLERLDAHRRVVGRDEMELQARRAGVDDEDAQVGRGQVQSLIAGSSSPCSRV